MQYVLWAVSFVSLWLTVLWLSVASFGQEVQRKLVKPSSKVSIAIPVFNGENGITRTLESLKQLDYPQELLEIIVVDDGSSDKSVKVAKEFANKNKTMNIVILQNKLNQGKGASVNVALARASGVFFAEIDCDSHVAPDSLLLTLAQFTSARVGAVIPSIKVDNPKTVYEKLQRVEYILSDLVRQLMARMNTLFFTHGVLCVFRTDVLRKVGGFDGDRNNITEDLEIALRLRANHYTINMSPCSIGFTRVPWSFQKLWRQRVRWFRGFVYNHIKYRHLIANPEYGLFGVFQLPLNVLSVALLLTTMVFVSYGLADSWWTFIARSFSVNGYFLNHVLDFPSIKEFFIGQNVQIVLPLMLGTALGLWLLVIA
ncbi:MAG: glycosyltransferase family 2 protein, partial [Candidatus Woesearchaeota archaeon]|nr:glycosyltransferase family 2 protein [Candidatus Woesearchaeota archaeon]